MTIKTRERLGEKVRNRVIYKEHRYLPPSKPACNNVKSRVANANFVVASLAKWNKNANPLIRGSSARANGVGVIK